MIPSLDVGHRLLAAAALLLAIAGCAAEAGRLDGPGFSGGYVGIGGGFATPDPGPPRR